MRPISQPHLLAGSELHDIPDVPKAGFSRAAIAGNMRTDELIRAKLCRQVYGATTWTWFSDFLLEPPPAGMLLIASAGASGLGSFRHGDSISQFNWSG
jgi:hypothetical protein